MTILKLKKQKYVDAHGRNTHAAKVLDEGAVELAIVEETAETVADDILKDVARIAKLAARVGQKTVIMQSAHAETTRIAQDRSQLVEELRYQDDYEEMGGRGLKAEDTEDPQTKKARRSVMPV